MTAAPTSLAKSASMVAVESSASNAMHSEMDRCGGIGACITATGSLPLSITISAPARTRASSPAKSLAASASEMWITWSATQRLYRYSPCSDSASKGKSRSGSSGAPVLRKRFGFAPRPAIGARSWTFSKPTRCAPPQRRRHHRLPLRRRNGLSRKKVVLSALTPPGRDRLTTERIH